MIIAADNEHRSLVASLHVVRHIRPGQPRAGRGVCTFGSAARATGGGQRRYGRRIGPAGRTCPAALATNRICSVAAAMNRRQASFAPRATRIVPAPASVAHPRRPLRNRSPGFGFSISPSRIHPGRLQPPGVFAFDGDAGGGEGTRASTPAAEASGRCDRHPRPRFTVACGPRSDCIDGPLHRFKSPGVIANKPTAPSVHVNGRAGAVAALRGRRNRAFGGAARRSQRGIAAVGRAGGGFGRVHQQFSNGGGPGPWLSPDPAALGSFRHELDCGPSPPPHGLRACLCRGPWPHAGRPPCPRGACRPVDPASIPPRRHPRLSRERAAR